MIKCKKEFNASQNISIILSSGMATRMRPASTFIPKSFFPIGNTPFIFKAIDAHISRNRTVFITVNDNFADHIYKALYNYYKKELLAGRIHVVKIDSFHKEFSPIYSLKTALKYIKTYTEPNDYDFILHFGDDWFDSLGELLDLLIYATPNTLVVDTEPIPIGSFGKVILGDGNEILDITRQSIRESSDDNFVMTGLMYLKNKEVEKLISCSNINNIEDPLIRLPVSVLKIKSSWYTIGDPINYRILINHLL